MVKIHLSELGKNRLQLHMCCECLMGSHKVQFVTVYILWIKKRLITIQAKNDEAFYLK